MRDHKPWGETYDLSIIAHKDDTLPDVWVSHCLDWDLVSQGNSPKEAIQAITEAVVLMIQDDLNDGFDPQERNAAPMECWAALTDIVRNGVRVEGLESLNGTKRFAGRLLVMVTIPEIAPRPAERVRPLPMLEAYQIASLGSSPQHHHC